MSTLAWMGFHTAWAIILPSALVVFAHGAHNPCGQSGAVGPFPEAAGTASALNGFLSMLCAFATGQWLGHTMDGTAAPLIQGIGFWSLIISLTSWTLVARYARP